MSDFTNRHGKKVQVVDDIDGVALVSHEQSTPKRSRTKRILVPKMKLPHIHISPRIMFIGFIVGILMLIVGIVMADSVKRDYERQAAAMRRAISTAGSIVPTSDASAVDIADTVLHTLSAPSSCQVKQLDLTSWYGPAKTARDDCVATAERFVRLRQAIVDIQAVARYVDVVQNLLETPLRAPVDGQFANIAEYTTAWDTAAAAVAQLKPSSQLGDVHANLIRHVTSIQASWAKLAAANEQHDVAAFKVAETELAAQYEQFRSVGTTIQTTLQKYQTAVTQAVATPQ